MEAGAASLTLHPRSAKQMYTGTADHSLTAELVELVDVPVIASGDVTSRASARRSCSTRPAAPRSWSAAPRRATRGPSARSPARATASRRREEVVAELVLFMRATLHELGEQRATGFLKKFYGWYLGRGRFPKPFKQELVQLATLAEVEERLFAAAPAPSTFSPASRASSPPRRTSLLDLPISAYGGG